MRRSTTAVLMSICLTSCINFERELPVKRRYLLQTERTGDNLKDRATSAILMVRPFHLALPLSGKNFVYRLSDQEYTSDFYNEFFGTPSDNLQSLSIQWLNQSALCQAVIASGSRLQPSHVLETDVMELHGDYSDETAFAVMQLRVTLLTESTDRLLFTKVYAIREPLEDKEPESLVQGWSRAIAKLLKNLEQDLVGRLL
ncbi:MAG: ABC-type transport auxiliary lipoprotein family protein [Planctomycetota bacterium]|jgi:ABC-type uncharacterized transport system auxiliary subunit|nr:ABC-type transport auxiliary lipoprotein family protein [Planctomycetota bacterium]